MLKTIYLDMDGVCVDFVRASLRLHGADPNEVLARWPDAEHWIHVVLGITNEEFWDKINRMGSPFWSGLKPYLWFEDMYAALLAIAPVVFLTSPSLSPSASKGKIQWLQYRFGWKFRDYIITNRKQHCARANTVLIDDHPEMVAAFRAEPGAHAILFPQVWNERGSSADWTDVVEAVRCLHAAPVALND